MRLDGNTQVKEQYRRSECTETGPSTQKSQCERRALPEKGNGTTFTSDRRTTERNQDKNNPDAHHEFRVSHRFKYNAKEGTGEVFFLYLGARMNEEMRERQLQHTKEDGEPKRKREAETRSQHNHAGRTVTTSLSCVEGSLRSGVRAARPELSRQREAWGQGSRRRRSLGCRRKSADQLVRQGRDMNTLPSPSEKAGRSLRAGNAEGGRSRARFLRASPVRPSDPPQSRMSGANYSESAELAFTATRTPAQGPFLSPSGTFPPCANPYVRNGVRSRLASAVSLLLTHRRDGSSANEEAGLHGQGPTQHQRDPGRKCLIPKCSTPFLRAVTESYSPPSCPLPFLEAGLLQGTTPSCCLGPEQRVPDPTP